MAQDQVKLPVWAIGLMVGLLSTVGGGAIVWGQVRADVESLKGEIRDSKGNGVAIASLQTEVPNLARRIEEMRQEVRDIKTSQSETQRDIKTILVELRKNG